MEVAERVSSFAGFDEKGSLNYQDRHLLLHGSQKDLEGNSRAVLDPKDLHLEVPYENQPLYWVSGDRVDAHGTHPILVPAQLVFLFCNLDEISLTSGLPSTGLASGNTLEQAKLHALLEVIERDAERVIPFSPDKCFLLDSDLREVKEILKRCETAGIHVQFLDMTSELGVPCYKAFVRGPNGEILKGSGANLDGKRAVVSALTEVPFHPSWFKPAPAPQDLKTVEHEGLPDYSSKDATRDLAFLEGLLVKNGYQPIYVNLTREDLDIPVVKALVPGLEILSDFDHFSAFSPRQFAHYLKAR
jgi:ribosomal protein S12 methylthiotransferase accessory factor YcaO